MDAVSTFDSPRARRPVVFVRAPAPPQQPAGEPLAWVMIIPVTLLSTLWCVLWIAAHAR